MNPGQGGRGDQGARKRGGKWGRGVGSRRGVKGGKEEKVGWRVSNIDRE